MSTPAGVPAYTVAHRLYVKSLYKRYLVNSLNWYIRRDLWRDKAIEIRAEFERNRNISDPRALALVLEQAEERLAKDLHPDPYRSPMFPDGTKWERNIPPRMFSAEEKAAALEAKHH
ncbi:uncharacterized protein MKK02DRAFT_40382 [Dioszegia hungarica]|uniref:NADH dehydrogenase [ubiquinone] 1 beta subcomplex subunit 9 n=1 Tax=Dioszegia hungarica TaxID=4972 RepID=A0AA38H1Q5_9TREE|nr:uncharacterized protein MKK02DRAFT_40382 [Dioszegia hungarica]KAI9633002.1 hypothetical protein MKK02DRAFT_40382 [Dioszegia hungarica]